MVLRLEGPLQSWGTQGRFELRDTEREPSKSGVIGICGAALGMARDDVAQLARLAALRLAVRVDRPGTKLRDYHTAGAGTFAGHPHTLWGAEPNETAVTKREYLADASFLVALGGEDDALVAAVAVALADPRWPLFLGRKACPPAVPILVGTTELAPEAAVRAFPARRHDAAAHLRILVEAQEGQSRQDVPVSFETYHRQHGRRFVKVESVAAASLPQETP